MCGDVVVDPASHEQRQSAASVPYCDLHLAIVSERNWEISLSAQFPQFAKVLQMIRPLLDRLGQ
jgi:hypothetical protein